MSTAFALPRAAPVPVLDSNGASEDSDVGVRWRSRSGKEEVGEEEESGRRERSVASRSHLQGFCGARDGAIWQSGRGDAAGAGRGHWGG